MKACRGEVADYTPVWLMRQAGRYMSEYRELRSKVTFMELCRSPELVVEVTVHARNRIGADAAILFADILLIIECLGPKLSFVKGDGPQIDPPLRDPDEVAQLPEIDVDELEHVYAGVKGIREALPRDIPLIGFAGAPFTVASYLIEGGPSKNFEHTKAIMYHRSDAWHELMGKLARGTASYLQRQIEAGAQAVQLFDSWVGCLEPDDYREFVMPYSKQIFDAISDEVPKIHFGKGTGLMLELIKEAGGDVVGVDFMTPLAEARQRLGDTPVQGNLDPVLLLGDREVLAKRIDRVLEQGQGQGHIFNLGHGILPNTPVDNVLYLIDRVHEVSRK